MASLTNIDNQAQGFFKYQSINKFIPNLIQIALIIGSLSTLLYLIWGGIQYITSGGNQDSIKNAKSKMSQAIFGLVILAVVWTLWRLAIYFLGLSDSASGGFQIKVPKP